MKFNSISKKLSSLILMLGIASFANAQKISIEPVTIAPGEEATFAINYEKEDVDFSNFQVDFNLPDGLTFVEHESEDEDGEPIIVHALKGTAPLASHNYRETLIEKYLLITLTNPNFKNFKNGSLLLVTVKADESLADVTEIAIPQLLLSGWDGDGKQVDVTFENLTVPVTKGTPTGINGIEANSEKAVSFNLAGQKFSANAKGIRIQNGKKVIVK